MKAGHRIKQLRTDRKITQKELGNAVGILQHDISRLEKQPKNHIVENWIRMAKFFGMTVEELYEGTDPKDISKISHNSM
jgi:DNA-binding XRE family transcriptional regulator